MPLLEDILIGMKYDAKAIRAEYRALKQTTDDQTRLSVLMKYRECPEDILSEVAVRKVSHNDTFYAKGRAQRVALSHPRLPIDTIKDLLSKIGSHTSGLSAWSMAAFLQNPSIPAESLNDFARQIMKSHKDHSSEKDKPNKSKDSVISIVGLNLRYALSNPNISPEIVDEIVREILESLKNVEAQILVLKKRDGKNTSADQRHLNGYRSTHKDVAVSIASNPLISEFALNQLIWYPDAEVKRALIKNKGIDPAKLMVWIPDSFDLSKEEKKRFVFEIRYKVIRALIHRLPVGASKARALEYLLSFSEGVVTSRTVARHSCIDADLERVAYLKDEEITKRLQANKDVDESLVVLSILVNGAR